MKKRVFITRHIPSVAEELLSAHFHVEKTEHNLPFSEEELVSFAQKYDALLSTFSDRLHEKVLSQASTLKVISNYAIGLDNIALEVAKQKQIAVYNLPDVVTESTADLTLALLLAFTRQIPQAARHVTTNQWKHWVPHLFMGEELQGKTLGILGFGRIGKAVAKRALAFGLRVIACNRSPIGSSNGVTEVSWDALLAQSDYLSLHVPLTRQTAGMIDLPAIRKMVRRPLLINVARGAVVKSQDLLTALDQGLLRGAALDVTDPEPLPLDHPLLRHERCLILPHIGTSTVECRTEMARMAAQHIINHFQYAQ